jgi:hypothetical protein
MKQIDPFRVLPLTFQKHLVVPYYVLAAWGFCVASLLVFFSSAGRPIARQEFAAASPALASSSPRPDKASVMTERSLLVSGQVSLQILIGATGHPTFTGDGLEGLVLRGEAGGEVRLNNAAGKTLYRYKPRDGGDKAKLYGPDGKVVYRVKDVDAEHKLKLRSPDGSELYRVKVKDDKFNVYDGKGTRIAKGKLKGGEYRVTSEPQGATIGTIKGAKDLGEAGILAMPVAAPYRLLLWYSQAEP